MTTWPLLLALATAQLQDTGREILRVGAPFEGEIDDEDEGVHTATLDEHYIEAPTVGEVVRLEIDEPGAYHVELRSYDFDAYLVLRDATGADVAENDDGEVGLHSVVSWEAEAPGVYEVVACALHGQRGAYALHLRRGRPVSLDPREITSKSLEDARVRLEHLEASRERNHPDTAAALDELGTLVAREGRYEEARRIYERALAIRQMVLGPDDLATATSLNSLALVLDALGRYPQAQELHTRALAIRENAVGPEHAIVAESLNNLGLVLKKQGRYQAARPLYERALAIREDVLGPEHSSVAATLNNLATLLNAQGLYVEARPLYERALEISTKSFGPDHAYVAGGLNNLGMLLKTLGLYEEARPLFEQAVATFERVRGPEHPSTATSLSNLAAVLEHLGLFEEARALHQRALVAHEKMLGPKHPSTAETLTALGILHGRLYELEEARRLHERALAIREEVLGPDHPSTAKSLNNLAIALEALGYRERARPLYERSLAIQDEALGPEHPWTSEALNQLAFLLADEGQDSEAWSLGMRATANRDLHLARVLASQSEHESYAYLGNTLWQLEFLLSLAALYPNRERRIESYECLLEWKGQVLRILRSSRSLLAKELSDDQERILAQLRDTQSRLSRWVLAGNSDATRLDAQLETLRESRSRLELDWIRSLGPAQRTDVSFRALALALPPASAVLDFFVHRRYVPPQRDGAEIAGPGSWGAPHLGVWVTRAASEQPTHIDLGPAAQAETAVQAFLESLRSSRGVRPESGNEADDATPIRSLLWAPIAPLLDGVETVFVSPDSFLGTLPFEVLQEENGDFLIERFAFVYLEDAASLARIEERATSQDSLLCVGGVDFRRRADRAEPAQISIPRQATTRGGFDYWEPLPATVAEAHTVMALHEDAHGDAGPRVHLERDEATEERLKVELPRHSVVHLATHGFFAPLGPPSLWVRTRSESGGRGGALGEPAERLVGDHPGLLSGLVCAGANERPEGDRDDGYLTAEEVGWLDLSGVDLVVLSACETGLGRAQSGEGLLGLRRAFRTAGAQTVISSLWSVRDESTSELMRRFYRGLWVEGMGKLAALRSAQLAVLQKNRVEHGRPLPSTWGAFVLSGDWQ